MQTVLVSELKNPVQTSWENRVYLYNPEQRKWHVKARNQFLLDASSSAVRQSTYEAGSGIWSSMLETDDDTAGPPDSGRPPVKKIVFMNRSIRIKGGEKGKPPTLNETNNTWVDSGDYTVYYRSTPVFQEFAAGSE
ncbi:MAG TPA: hypothetical protein VLK82_17920 [Candidatus Tectomicrobia bacterium]|nr:hypothetical protein [Candidatus Tectomicrobia bacterium]